MEAPPEAEPCVVPDVVSEHSGTIGDEIWESGVHVVTRNVRVEGTLVVDPCSRIEVASGAGLDASRGGSFQMLGSEMAPIVITSTSSDPRRGDWNNITLGVPRSQVCSSMS